MFPVAIWYQPVANFAVLSALGINTVVGCELETIRTPDQVVAAAAQTGLAIWPTVEQMMPLPPNLKSTVDPSSAVAGYLLTPDEPDGVGATPGPDLQAKRNIARLTTKRPLMVSLDANQFQWHTWQAYQDWADACSDVPGGVICEDYYPANTKGTLDEKRKRIRFLRSLVRPGQQVWSVIECSDQNIHRGGRGPTPDETMAQVDMAIAEGVDGIMYFAHRFEIGWPAGFLDGVSTEMRVAMRLKNKALQAPKAPAVPQPKPLSPGMLTVKVPGYDPVYFPLNPS